MQSFNKEGITFISRIKENRKYKEIESLITDGVSADLDSLILLKDCIVHLYGSKIVIYLKEWKKTL
jgi:hypothetical protein